LHALIRCGFGPFYKENTNFIQILKVAFSINSDFKLFDWAMPAALFSFSKTN